MSHSRTEQATKQAVLALTMLIELHRTDYRHYEIDTGNYLDQFFITTKEGFGIPHPIGCLAFLYKDRKYSFEKNRLYQILMANEGKGNIALGITRLHSAATTYCNLEEAIGFEIVHSDDIEKTPDRIFAILKTHFNETELKRVFLQIYFFETRSHSLESKKQCELDQYDNMQPPKLSTKDIVDIKFTEVSKYLFLKKTEAAFKAYYHILLSLEEMFSCNIIMTEKIEIIEKTTEEKKADPTSFFKTPDVDKTSTSSSSSSSYPSSVSKIKC